MTNPPVKSAAHDRGAVAPPGMASHVVHHSRVGPLEAISDAEHERIQHRPVEPPDHAIHAVHGSWRPRIDTGGSMPSRLLRHGHRWPELPDPFWHHVPHLG